MRKIIAPLAMLLLVLGGCTIETDPGGKDVSSKGDGGSDPDLVRIALELSWTEMPRSDRTMMCVGWNGGQQETLVDAFMSEFDSPPAGVTTAEVEAGLRDFMDDTC